MEPVNQNPFRSASLAMLHATDYICDLSEVFIIRIFRVLGKRYCTATARTLRLYWSNQSGVFSNRPTNTPFMVGPVSSLVTVCFNFIHGI